MKAKTRKELDKLGCCTPGCTCDAKELCFHSECHPEAPTWVWYDKRTGELTIRCGECERVVTVVKVAEDSTEWREVAVH